MRLTARRHYNCDSRRDELHHVSGDGYRQVERAGYNKTLSYVFVHWKRSQTKQKDAEIEDCQSPLLSKPWSRW